ncbi:hypothetical protein S83_001721, partial [Arachis hypogaea]
SSPFFLENLVSIAPPLVSPSPPGSLWSFANPPGPPCSKALPFPERQRLQVLLRGRPSVVFVASSPSTVASSPVFVASFPSSVALPQISGHCTRRSSNFPLDLDPNESRKLVVAVKEKLEKEHYSLPVGKNGRDDEDMILWFLKDRKFYVKEAVKKLTKAIKWRKDFNVAELTEEAVKDVAQTGKAYVHDFLDIYGRPVLMVVASKHFPEAQDPKDDERLCVFLVEKALSMLPTGKEQMVVIVDLRGFGTENADLKYLTFLFDVFYYYYPKRLGEVLFVDAPFVFKPIWQIAKPLLKSYASLVRFCSAEEVRKEYFTDKNLPPNFRD